MKGQAAALLASSFRPPLATIFSVPSGNGRWSFSAFLGRRGHPLCNTGLGREDHRYVVIEGRGARLVLLRHGPTAGRRSLRIDGYLPVAVGGSNIRSAIVTAVSVSIVSSPIAIVSWAIGRIVASIAVVNASVAIRIPVAVRIGAIAVAVGIAVIAAVVWRCGCERDTGPDRKAGKAPTPTASTPVRLGRGGSCDGRR